MTEQITMEEAEDRTQESLDETCEPFKVGTLEYPAGRVLREIDPIAFREVLWGQANADDWEVV
ncbi:MAG TPA: hypothetical protein VF245_12615 [Solirubrobacterales bacterium]